MGEDPLTRSCVSSGHSLLMQVLGVVVCEGGCGLKQDAKALFAAAVAGVGVCGWFTAMSRREVCLELL